ncbi:uncharacterized protein LOC110022819 [Phalaenopsis equestris]|uniref:uncharacterized protein LOC110022819 n=1 Tax=Phalaenopsis equestris TaxID=78828 RepID=UPI0009E40365|nr:uncharacterized protein LOC110022819 [Phalaenopsis equestris]
MKIAQFLCFSPDVAEERITTVHVIAEVPPCHRQRRWRRRLAGIIFPALISPQANVYADVSSTPRRRGGQFSGQKPTFASETSSVRKSDSDDGRGSDELIFSSSSSSSPKTLSASPFLPVPKSKEMVEAAAERRCALFFLVVSLMVMVFCGRICAILWTASVLRFLPRRKTVPESPYSSKLTPSPTSDLRPRACCEYDRKRVVLEGFLLRRKGLNSG